MSAICSFRQASTDHIFIQKNTNIYTLTKGTSTINTSKHSYSSSYKDVPESISMNGNIIDYSIVPSNPQTLNILTTNPDSNSYAIYNFNTINKTPSLIFNLPAETFPPKSINNLSTTTNNIILAGQYFSILSSKDGTMSFRYPAKPNDETNYNFINPKSNFKVLTVFSAFNTLDKTLYVFDVRKESPIFKIPLEMESSEEFYGHFWNMNEGTQIFIFTKKEMKVVDLRLINKSVFSLSLDIVDCVAINNVKRSSKIQYLFLTSDNRILFYSKKFEDLGSVSIDKEITNNLSFVEKFESNIDSMRIQSGDKVEGIDISYKNNVRVNTYHTEDSEVICRYDDKDNITEYEVKKLCLKRGKEEKNRDSELGMEIKEVINKYKQGKLKSFFDNYKPTKVDDVESTKEKNTKDDNESNEDVNNSLEASFFDSIATTENTTNSNTYSTATQNKEDTNTLQSKLSLLLLEKNYLSIISLIKDIINNNKQITEDEKYKLKSLVYFVYYLTLSKQQTGEDGVNFDKYYLECYLKEQNKETNSYSIAMLLNYDMNNKVDQLISLLEPTKDNLVGIYSVIKSNKIELTVVNTIVEKMLLISPVFSIAVTLSMDSNNENDKTKECFVQLIRKLKLRRRVKIEIVNLYNNVDTDTVNLEFKESSKVENKIMEVTEKNKNKEQFEDVTEKFIDKKEYVNATKNIKDNERVQRTKVVDGLLQIDICKDKLNNNDIKKLSMATKKIYDLKLDTLESELINKLNDFIELVNDKNVKEADKVRTEIVKTYWKKHKGWLINLVTIMGVLKKT